MPNAAEGSASHAQHTSSPLQAHSRTPLALPARFRRTLPAIPLLRPHLNPDALAPSLSSCARQALATSGYAEALALTAAAHAKVGAGKGANAEVDGVVVTLAPHHYPVMRAAQPQPQSTTVKDYGGGSGVGGV